MSTSECLAVLDDCYDRAVASADADDLPGIRRAFRKAYDEARAGNPRPAILLAARYT